MKPQGLALLALFASLPDCGRVGRGESPAAPQNPPLGREFRLKPGEVAVIGGEDLRVGFEAVTSDSRCPAGVSCIWAGEATVKVWTQHPSSRKAVHELHTPGRGPAEASYLGYTLRLVGLAPYPREVLKIPPKDYVATLVVKK